MPDINQYYARADKRMGDKRREYLQVEQSFREIQGKCLQIGFRDKPIDGWDVLDKYDPSPLITHRLDLMDTGLPSETYDAIFCPAILEHVEYPDKAVAEMHRLLKPNGEILVVVPFNQHYHPSPNDYYRWTPQGIKILMRKFHELDSGYFRIHNSVMYTAVYFYGRR